MRETVPQQRRIYLVLEQEGDQAQLRMSATPPDYQADETLAVLISRGAMPAGHPVAVQLMSAPEVTALDDVTLTQKATVAISAGVRTLTIAAPGVKAGDAILLKPRSVIPNGYLIGEPVATADDTLKVPVLAPLLAIGASYSILCRVVRLNV